MFDIKIVATGSRGNCIIIDDVLMFDTGCKVKSFKKWGQNVKYLFLTHRHGDHTNKTILNHIAKNKPYLIQNGLYANLDTYNRIDEKIKNVSNLCYNNKRIVDENFDKLLIIGEKIYKIKAFKLVHDVENYGFIIVNELGEKLIFATDTSTMEYAPNDKYDYLLIEGNYDENTIMEELESGDDEKMMRALRNLRHLSMQGFENFVKRNSKKDSKIFQLHESLDFGLRSKYSINYLPFELLDEMVIEV